jgi:hypothetical protein
MNESNLDMAIAVVFRQHAVAMDHARHRPLISSWNFVHRHRAVSPPATTIRERIASGKPIYLSGTAPRESFHVVGSIAFDTHAREGGVT